MLPAGSARASVPLLIASGEGFHHSAVLPVGASATTASEASSQRTRGVPARRTVCEPSGGDHRGDECRVHREAGREGVVEEGNVLEQGGGQPNGQMAIDLQPWPEAQDDRCGQQRQQQSRGPVRPARHGEPGDDRHHRQTQIRTLLGDVAGKVARDRRRQRSPECGHASRHDQIEQIRGIRRCGVEDPSRCIAQHREQQRREQNTGAREARGTAHDRPTQRRALLGQHRKRGQPGDHATHEHRREDFGRDQELTDGDRAHAQRQSATAELATEVPDEHPGRKRHAHVDRQL